MHLQFQGAPLNNDPFGSDHLTYITSVEQSKALVDPPLV
jgi:hypothetical protein